MIIVAVVALTFGSGLAVGYGLLARHSKAASKSSARQTAPSAIQNSVPSEADKPVMPPNAADAYSAAKPFLNSPEPTTPLRAQAQFEPFANNSANHPQSSTAKPLSAQNEEPHAATESRLAPRNASAFINNSASADRGAGQPGAAIAQPLNIPLSRAPVSGQSTQPIRQAAAAPSFGHPTNEPGASGAADGPETTTLPGASSPGAAEPQITNDLAEDAGQPTSLGPINPCQLVRSVQPVYPEEAKRLHVEGDVELRIVVGTDGTVQSVRLISGPALLAPAAIDAAREFRYKPAMLNGQPIETVQTVAMSFNLKN